ncbi:hypothetical protein B0H34DRAFT_677610 [Crassisporium funariophilum]|nr:hypothetical protein B0H34DRAFT_677610 [Crassisporium funariophilum]
MPWVTLQILLRPSKSAQKLPRFLRGNDVAGKVILNLDNPQVINSITISLKGRIVTGFSANGGFFTFLEQSNVIWHKLFGDPQATSLAPKFDGKLSSNYKFHFSFPFPTEVNISSVSGSKDWTWDAVF